MDDLIRHGGDIYGKGAVLDFSANINPKGMPASVRQAAVKSIGLCAAYPDPLCRELRAAISEFHGVPKEHIVCGNGAADVIFRLVQTIKPQRAQIISPTFSEYESALRLVGCEVSYLDLKPENGFEPHEKLVGEIAADMVFFCNPNNPTGIAKKSEFTLRLAEKCGEAGALLVVDECFSSFLQEEEAYSAVRYLASNQKLFILKAFTKMYAMAGIRLGYGLCGDQVLIERVTLTGQPWSVSTVASKCGVAALKEREFVKETVLSTAKERTFLKNRLVQLGLRVYASAVNYLLFQSADTELCRKLGERGILIRSCANYRGLDETYYRIAVKSHEDNVQLIEALAAVLKQFTNN